MTTVRGNRDEHRDENKEAHVAGRAGLATVAADVPFFSSQWAARVAAAVETGLAPETRTPKLGTYWEWVDRARARYHGSWAIGVRNPPDGDPSWLVLDWSAGQCTGARITGAQGAASADFQVSADSEDWRGLLDGYDPGRAVMDRKLVMERGRVLDFFSIVYFFIEVVRCVASVPASLPA